jgi:hypothetical protein
MREWSYSSTILLLGTIWRWVVSFTQLLLCLPRKSPRYPTAYEYGRAPNPVWTLWSKENLFSLPGIELQPSSPSLSRLLRWLSIYLTIFLFIYGSRVFLLDLGRFFSLLILYTAGRTPWTGDRPVAGPLTTHRTTQTRNKRIQTCILRVGFEPTIPASARHFMPRRRERPLWSAETAAVKLNEIQIRPVSWSHWTR